MEISMGVYIESRYFDVTDLLPAFVPKSPNQQKS
jgi:hypothetical protein